MKLLFLDALAILISLFCAFAERRLMLYQPYAINQAGMVSGAIMIVITAIMTGEQHDRFSMIRGKNETTLNTSHHQTTPCDKSLLQGRESM